MIDALATRLAALAVCGACAGPAVRAGDVPRAPELERRFRQVVGSVFEREGVAGSFVLHGEAADLRLRFDPERASRPMPPASTFKIVNSLIALDEGVVADEHESMKWDGVAREIDSWNRDQTLETALQRSAVWYYQELARRIGPERMKLHLDRVGYGNAVVGDRIDTFWLGGPLEITPDEQVEFVRRLARGDLPFSRRALDIVRRILIVEQSDEFVLRGKTGWSIRPDPDIGWFVGYLTAGGDTWSFALNVDIAEDGRGRPRQRMTCDILHGLGLIGSAGDR